MNGDKIFVDTNVLVYGHDVDSGPKHPIARGVLLDLWQQKKDGLIISAASQAAATKILAEDLQSGLTIEGILLENPFL